MLKLYRTPDGAVLEQDGRFGLLRGADWDRLINRDDLPEYLDRAAPGVMVVGDASLLAGGVRPPIGSQEVWAAGVTYFRSRTARMEEAKSAGGGDFYDRVYDAERPELFFKSSPHRVSGHLQPVRIRRDSRWNVPEPELTLLITSSGRIVGYTIGNDMSSRDIEGENPLYLPQAKVYDRSCALGPGVLVTSEPLPASTTITLEIARDGQTAFAGETSLAAMKRTLASLVEFLFRDNSFPAGCFLLTGTGIVPEDDFTLQPGDRVRITIEPIGTLINDVE
jgi:2-dehydro-3-deoxy-D-arabinonate dehydratase